MDANKTPTRSSVLFVVPTIGQRIDLLRQSLKSIASQKPQAPDIVVVGSEKPEIKKIVKEFGATLAKDPRSGLSGAINAGFALAKPWHKYGSWMGDDDLLRPRAIATALKALEDNVNSVLAFGYCDYIDNRGHILFTNKAGNLAPRLLRWGPNLIPLMGVLYDLSIARKVGGYDESLKYAMDLDMWLKLKQRGAFINTHKVLGAFRWHDTSTTVANRRASIKETFRIKRRYLPAPMRRLALLWEFPVTLATILAVRQVNAKAKRLANNIR